jgi:hypothetical protein
MHPEAEVAGEQQPKPIMSFLGRAAIACGVAGAVEVANHYLINGLPIGVSAGVSLAAGFGVFIKLTLGPDLHSNPADPPHQSTIED